MKKTSKKLLSFFLAIVMIITSCSVGLTAFAEEPTNEGYWSQDANAESAFGALNDLVDTYVPALLNIEAIKDLLEGSLGVKVTEETTIADVIEGASPFLMKALGTNVDKGAIRGNTTKVADLYFAYLDDEDSAVDFYTLYKFCQTNQDLTYTDEKGQTKKVKDDLDSLLKAYSTYNAQYQNDYKDAISKMAEYKTAVTSLNLATCTLDEVNNATIDGTTLKDADTKDIDTLIAYYNGIFSTLGSDIEVSTVADAFYYTNCTLGIQEFSTVVYLGLALLGGAEIKNSNDTVITMSNYKDELADPYKFLIPTDNKAGAVDSPYYADICKGLLTYINVDTSFLDEAVITDEQIDAFLDYAITKNGVLNRKRTSSSGTVTVTIQANGFQNYLKSEDCAFSDVVTESFLNFLFLDNGAQNKTNGINTKVDNFLKEICKPNTLEESKQVFKSYIIDFGTSTAGHLSKMPFTEVVTTLCASNYIIQNVNDTNVNNIATKISSANNVFTLLSAFKSNVEPKLEDYKYSYGKYNLDPALFVDAANEALNDKLGELLGSEMVTGVISGLLGDVDILALTKDIWLNLYENPVATIANLIPVLAKVLDEFAVPILFNGKGDLYNADGGSPLLYTLLASKEMEGILYNYTQIGETEAYGETGVPSDVNLIGVGALSFDLNTILPSVLHWIAGDNGYNFESLGKYSGIYDSSVYKFTNIYIADKFISNLRGQDAVGKLLAGAIEDQQLATILTEVIGSVSSLLATATDNYLADHAGDVRVDTLGKTTQSGLNNIFVGLPQYIDYIGKAFLAKYKVTSSDWAYAYDGKIKQDPETGNYLNTTFESFKNLASENKPELVLESIVDFVIGHVLNGALDLVNDVIEDENTPFDSDLALIETLLNALGGLGEKSVITDVLNGFFQITRDDEASFTISEQAETGFKGFSNKSGLFLISNVGKLVDFIVGLTGSGETETFALTETQEEGPSPRLTVVTPPEGKSYSYLLTNENVAAADEVISKLDVLLASLLKNSSINGFHLNTTQGILSGISQFVDLNGALDLLTNLVNLLSGDADSNEYTSANLSALVISTYTMVEGLINNLTADLDENGIIAGAINGIISPDSVGIRMNESYNKTIKQLVNGHKSWTELDGKDLDYGFSKGDIEGFYDALGESFNGLASIIGIVLAEIKANDGRNFYDTLLNPILTGAADVLGIDAKVMTSKEFANASNAQRFIKGVLVPLGCILTADQIFETPVTVLIELIQKLAGNFEDTKLSALFESVTAPINGVINEVISGAADLMSNTSPSLEALLNNLATSISIDLEDILEIKEVDNKLVSIIDGLTADVILLPAIDWNEFASAKTAGSALLLAYGYLFDTLLGSDLIMGLLEGLDANLVAVITSLTPEQILNIIGDVLDVAKTPTEVYWTFSEYATSISNVFTYPTRITAKDADNAVKQLDGAVDSVFALLKDLGVADINGLASLVNDNLYTNKMLTDLTVAVYGAVEDLGIIDAKDMLANVLVDKSYGTTFTSAANTIKKAKTFKSIKSINWGFTDGSAKASTGFVNGLAAILRPLNGVLSIFLANTGDSTLTKADVDTLVNVIKAIELDVEPVTINAGVLTIAVEGEENTNEITIDIAAIVNDFLGSFVGKTIDLGSNGYESAIVPLLEAFMCKGVKTYDQYIADYNKAKDNLLIDILTPIVGLVSDVTTAPVSTLTKILPNVAYFIDSNGITQFLNNLLAPIVSEKGIVGALTKNGIDIDKIIEIAVGAPLGTVITNAISDALGVTLKVKVNLEIAHLEKCNIQDIVVPLVSSILKSKLGLVLPAFDFKTIASHGTIQTVKSAAMNANGKYTTLQVIADQGEVLVAVLRYVADVIITNATAIKNIVLGIDAVKKNKTIANIVSTIFNQIKTASKDDLVRAVFYLFMKNGTDSFFSYRDFKTKANTFEWGALDQEFCETLPPMLDGLVSGLLEGQGGLLGLVTGLVYKDELVAKLAKGLYGAIEGVKISDSIGSLTTLLKHFDVDFSTANVAALLTDKSYGQTYPSVASKIKSAGSWSKVNENSLSFGVTDRASFVNALCAVLRPLYGVLDIFLNDSFLNLADIASVPGSDCYTSVIVPLLEAFSCYNIKTQYQYREDMSKAYDAILIDVLNPLLDKVEDLLLAPVQTLTSMLPNLSLFFANDGLLQVIDNLLTPVSSILGALSPIVNVNSLLAALGFNLNSLIAKAGLNIKINLDVYDIKGSLKPLIGAENVVGLLNTILGIIKIGGKPLGIVLPEIDWLKLASHGDVINAVGSQSATHAGRMFVIADSAAQEAEVLIAVLRFVIDTVNYKGNYDAIVGLIGGLLGDASSNISDVVGQVLGKLQGDSDTVIQNLVELLQSFA